MTAPPWVGLFHSWLTTPKQRMPNILFTGRKAAVICSTKVQRDTNISSLLFCIALSILFQNSVRIIKRRVSVSLVVIVLTPCKWSRFVSVNCLNNKWEFRRGASSGLQKPSKYRSSSGSMIFLLLTAGLYCISNIEKLFFTFTWVS